MNPNEPSQCFVTNCGASGNAPICGVNTSVELGHTVMPVRFIYSCIAGVISGGVTGINTGDTGCIPAEPLTIFDASMYLIDDVVIDAPIRVDPQITFPYASGIAPPWSMTFTVPPNR